MASLEDVRRIAIGLPEVTEKLSWGSPFWQVNGKGFVWERPLRKKDLVELGEAAPTGPIAGVRVIDEADKQALIAGNPDVFFTISHFDGYPAVLIRLDAVEIAELTEVIEDAWLDRAPKRLAEDFLAGRG